MEGTAVLRLWAATLGLLVVLAGPSGAQSQADPEAATGWQPKALAVADRHMIVERCCAPAAPRRTRRSPPSWC